VALTLRKRKPGNPGEVDLNPAQVAQGKSKNKLKRVGQAVLSPRRVAPKNRSNKPERAAEAAANSSAVCTAAPF
jgi:hypothetical protein